MQKDCKKSKIPIKLKPLFWSYEFSSLCLEKNKRLIVKQILNYGTIEDWRWLVKVYGKKTIQETITTLYESELNRRSLKLAQLLFKAKPFYASRNVEFKLKKQDLI